MSLRKAINDHCKDCSYDPLDHGTWRGQVEACSVISCALWPYRPKTTKKAAEGAVSGQSSAPTGDLIAAQG